MIAANYVYNVAKPDGLTLGSIAPALYLAQLTGNKEVKFDWAKYTWIGTPEHNGTLLFMRADTPYKSIEDIRKAKEPPKCSATGVGTSRPSDSAAIGRDVKPQVSARHGLSGRRRARLGPRTRRSSMPCHYCCGFFRTRALHQLVQEGRCAYSRSDLAQAPRDYPGSPHTLGVYGKEKASDSNRRLATVALGSGGFGSWPIVSTPGLPAERTEDIARSLCQNAPGAGLGR